MAFENFKSYFRDEREEELQDAYRGITPPKSVAMPYAPPKTVRQEKRVIAPPGRAGYNRPVIPAPTPNRTPVSAVKTPFGIPVGMDIIQPYSDDNMGERIGKGIVNYGLGTAARMLDAPQQLIMQGSTNLANAIQGRPLDFSEKDFVRDILPAGAGEKLGQFKQAHPVAGTFAELLARDVADPLNYVAGGTAFDLIKGVAAKKTGALLPQMPFPTRTADSVADTLPQPKTIATESPTAGVNIPPKVNAPAGGLNGSDGVVGRSDGIVPELPQRVAVPDVKPPKSTLQTNRPTPTGNIREAGFSASSATDELTPKAIRDWVTDDPIVYNQLKHADTVKAADEIMERGYDQALGYWFHKENATALRPEDTVLAVRLSREAVARGDEKTAREITAVLASKLTTAGQATEAVKILRKSDPETIVMSLDRNIAKMNEEGLATYGDKWTNVELTEVEIKKIYALRNKKDVVETAADAMPKKQSTPRAKKVLSDAEVASAMKRDEVRAKVLKFAEEQESAARQRIAARRGQLNAVSIPVDVIYDYSVIGAAKLAKGTVKFSKWAEEMIGEFGDDIKSRLPEIYDRAKSLHKEHVGKLTIDEFEKGIKAKTERQLATEQLLKEIGERIAKEIPATNREKFDAWRKMAMLANVKTHVRNMGGNLMMMGERRASDTVAAIGEDLAEKFGIITKGQRTKALGWSKDKDLVQLVKDDWTQIKDDITRHGRWDIVGRTKGVNFYIPDKDMFKTGWLQAVYAKSSKLLNAEDIIFMRPAYEDALGGFMKSRGLKEVTVEAREYAQRRALEATFRQHSELATFLNKLKMEGGLAGTAVDVLQPFVKTPINITKNAASYSPLGVLRLFEKANRDPAKMIEVLAQGLTGSAITALGAFAAGQGWARAEPLRSKAGEQIMSLDGKQPYSLNILGANITMEWAQPTMSAFFAGVAAWEKATDDEKRSLAASLGKGAVAFADSLLGMSVWRTVGELAGGNGSVGTKLAEIPLDYMEQMNPTVVGQLARTVDPIKRNTTDNNPVKAFGKRMMAKTPGLSKMLEAKVDILGNPIKQGNATEQFISPGYVKMASKDPATSELARLYEATNDSAMLPNIAQNSIRHKGKDINLTDSEVTKFQTMMGRANAEALGRIFSVPEYKQLSDEDKVKVVRKVTDKVYDDVRESFLIYKAKNAK